MEIPYRNLVWLTYRLAGTFALGLPLVLLAWASIKKEGSIIRLLTIYWKVASLTAISMLLLTNQQPIGYITLFISPILMLTSIWFWIDLNEELSDLPQWRPLPLTTRIWRWTLTSFCALFATTSFLSLQCTSLSQTNICLSWLEGPNTIHMFTKVIFKFLFGANWNEPLAAFVGYVALIIYILGFLQWLAIKLPRQGRITGGF